MLTSSRFAYLQFSAEANGHMNGLQFAEQYNAVLPGTLSSIACAGAAVIAVSLILIPEPVASLWVGKFNVFC